MRETCARVLAAALMTGAIAFALGAPALFESSRDEIQALIAPPSSLQRSVRVPALPAPARPRRADRLAAAQTIRRGATVAVERRTPRTLVRKVRRVLAAAPPRVEAQPAQPPVETPPPAPAPPPPPPEDDDDGEEAKHKDKDRDKAKEKERAEPDDDDDDDGEREDDEEDEDD
jgi:hypothetical protein